MSKTKTAVCMDSSGMPVSVECRMQENWHGAPSLKLTLERLAHDHPELEFVDWVYDRDEDSDAIKLNFMSPNVLWRDLWIASKKGLRLERVYRSQLDQQEEA